MSSAYALTSFRLSIAHCHSSSDEPIGTIFPTVEGTTVSIFPPSPAMRSIVSLQYWIEPIRT